jgi:hypothetical protein
MTAIHSVNSAALQIMRQFQPSPATADGKATPVDSMVAAANGVRVETADADGGSADSVFSPNHLDPTQMKIRLMERVGDEFGIDMDDFDDQASYGLAIQKAVSEIRAEPGGHLVLAEIEKSLGLDELGLSIDEMINAIIDPGSSDGDKLDAALEEKAGNQTDGGETSSGSVTLSDIGIYSRQG